ncbi:MAG: B12-binding domain-containing radical SAM protein [Candidatus Fonsibacter sp.]
MLDKDTWIAQNLIPKNLEASNIRKPRLNVTPVDFSKATRKTKFTLCVLGSWAIYMPPYNLARLSSLIRESGYPLRVFDLNVESHYALKDANPDLADAWNGANYWWWQEDEYYTRIHPTYEPILKEYLEILLKDDPDIIGFSTYYTNILPTRWMVNEIRKRRPDITIIFGGPECHERNFKTSEGVDYYFIGESEQTILDFLNNWENGIKPVEPKIGSLYSDTRIDIDSLPYPDYSDFDLQKYWGKNSICAEISRGCIAKCSYCTEVYYWKFRDRGASSVVDELEQQVLKYDIGFVSFVDSLMNGNLKEFRRFCEELVERNLGFTWWGYARADGRMDLDFYQLMAKAGCQGFNYGIETGSDKVLQAINKKNTVAEINQNIIDSHKVGMKISACWVIGAPGEDIEAFTHSFNMLWNHRARIMAVSPGPGLGDNYGSAYDDREKFNINPRNEPWLGGWYTLDLTNTRVHRFIRIKLMHMWLHLCKESGGTLSNVHKTGEITDHFSIKFDSEYINDSVEYENFDFNIINSGHGVFADSVMNEVFGFLRMLWRVRGGYEISIKFNKALDHQDFIFAITPDTNSYDADIWFKIDEDGNYQTDFKFNFINVHKNIVPMEGFDYEYKQAGKWTEAKKTQQRKIFYMASDIPQPVATIVQKNILPMESCFSSMSIPERKMLLNFTKRLPNDSIIVETNSTLGGRAAIMARANNNVQINSVEEFRNGVLKNQFDNMESWIKQQLVDAAKENDINETKAIEFLTTIENNLRDDATGKEAWKTVTGNYSNIQLVENADRWNTPIDFCFINVHKNPSLKVTLDFWDFHIKSKGYLMAHLYDEAMCPDVYHEINNLIQQGWKLIRTIDKLVLIQKP